MATRTSEELPHQGLQRRWPQKFSKRRLFNRQTENQSYIEFLLTSSWDGEEEEEGDASRERDDENGSTGLESGFEGHRCTIEQDEGIQTAGDGIDPTNNVRLFMTGLTGDVNDLQYRDQVEQVAGFYEHARLSSFESNTIDDTKHVALLDERKLGVDISEKRGYSRPYCGPLTSRGLREMLGRKPFKLDSKPNTIAGALEDEHHDAERRLIFISDLDPSIMETIMMTASRTKAPALKDFFYKYLTSKTSIGVTIPSRGFTVFNLDFHIPYFALRVSEKLLTDTRRKFNCKPLRQSWDLAFMTTPRTSSKYVGGVTCLYEAQISVVLSGIDHGVWTAYCVVETYFDSEDNVDGYHDLKGQDGVRADPLAAGHKMVDDPIWAPREYFFRILEIRMTQVLREWNSIVDNMVEEVKQTNKVFPLSYVNRETMRQEVRQVGMWNRQMVELLRRLVRTLSDTVDAWNEFGRKDVGYFEYDGQPPNFSFETSKAAVANIFLKLEPLLRKLQSLEKELCKDNPQGVHAHLSIENNDAAIFQQRAAGHIEVLTVVTIVFFPLALAAALFSTTGVLPFAPNPVRFTYVLLVLTVLIVVTLVVLWHRRSWLRSVVAFADFIRKPIIHHEEELAENDFDGDASPLSEFATWKLLPCRSKHSYLNEEGDLETGTLRRRHSELEQS